jgi:hypothetical protein
VIGRLLLQTLLHHVPHAELGERGQDVRLGRDAAGEDVVDLVAHDRAGRYPSSGLGSFRWTSRSSELKLRPLRAYRKARTSPPTFAEVPFVPGHAAHATQSSQWLSDIAMTLPRTTEALVHDRVKFRVGRIVYVAFSRDEKVMGFGFPKQERDALVRTESAKFLMPKKGDLRYNWLEVRLDAIDQAEMRELVLDAWRMCVPKRLAAACDPTL